MNSTYRATVRGSDPITGEERTDTFVVDIGRFSQEPSAESRVVKQAESKAFSEGIEPEHVFDIEEAPDVDPETID